MYETQRVGYLSKVSQLENYRDMYVGGCEDSKAFATTILPSRNSNIVYQLPRHLCWSGSYRKQVKDSGQLKNFNEVSI